MASTFTLTSTAYSGRYLQLYCTQSKDIATNKSKISWTLSSIGGRVDYYSTGPTSVYINGERVYYSDRKNWDTRAFPAAEGSTSGAIYVAHDAGGDKSIQVSLSTAIYVSAVSTNSGTWELDNIPRQARILQSSDFDDTQLPTVTYNNPLGDSVESVEICIADDRAYGMYTPYRAINKTGTLSYTFEKADIDLLKNKAVNTLDISFVIKTKLYGAYYYDAAYNKFTMTENDDTKPSISVSVEPDNDSLPSIFDGVYIQGKSKISASISAQGKYGASISSYSTTVDGKSYSGASITTSAIENSGEIELTGSVKDSRGFTNSANKKINVIPYSAPYITSFTLERQADGTTVIATLKGGISPVENKNTKSFSVTLNGVTQAVAADYTVDGTTTFLDVPTDSTLTATAKIEDAFSAVTKDAILPTVDVTLDFHSSGTGIKFGGVAENPNLFECDWDVQFNQKLNVRGKSTLNNALADDVLAFALACDSGITPFSTHSGSTNLPGGAYDYSCGLVHKREDNQIDVYVKDYTKGQIAVNTYLVSADGSSRTWSGWHFLQGIVSYGTSGNWVYRKWSDGTIEQWGNFTVNFTAWSAWGALYEANSYLPNKAFPLSYSAAPVVSANVYGSSYGAILEAVGAPTRTQTPQYYLVRATNSIAVPNSFTVSIYAIGK